MPSKFQLSLRLSEFRLHHTHLSDFAGGEVPDLDEPVHRPRHQVLTVGGKPGTLNVRLLSKLSREETKDTRQKLGHKTKNIRLHIPFTISKRGTHTHRGVCRNPEVTCKTF